MPAQAAPPAPKEADASAKALPASKRPRAAPQASRPATVGHPRRAAAPALDEEARHDKALRDSLVSAARLYPDLHRNWQRSGAVAYAPLGEP
ncbi:hypothetical protein BKK79_07780 [Cupriavidus sp. USMAA2-4]|uniref:hypothetical protein n=1 Tax=Cupriavidus sp. USMAA2-4 TaxID=876364 RepID=UPI0008A68E09|nr:hypothetical protein [Cupriavidus sp. USMAA2-4]AOY91708.1 hypothetical protein BKK79_07780 [Cupriavidus sp. USMAA2-4]